MLIMRDDERMTLLPGEVLQDRMVRFRTLGCYPLTGAVKSDAATLPEIVSEMLVSRTSERQGRMIDKDEAARWKRRSARAISDVEVRPRPKVTPAATAAEEISAYMAEQEKKSLLRFLTCGSVDDGKSTLIGRLLYDTKLIFEDQLAALTNDSRKHGTNGEDIDFALLVDGLEAEREQGITIDVAYRFFSTPKRKFIVADTPGHEQYTRNMATGASTADLAIVLVDARQGVLRRLAATVTSPHSWAFATSFLRSTRSIWSIIRRMFSTRLLRIIRRLRTNSDSTQYKRYRFRRVSATMSSGHRPTCLVQRTGAAAASGKRAAGRRG